MKTNHFIKQLLTLVIVSVVLACQAGSAQAEEHNTLCIPTNVIQPLIIAAAEGGIVTIPAGTYCETLTINKSLTLRGASMNTTTLLPATTGQRVITVDFGYNLRLENLKITGGQALTDSSNAGGGVWVKNGNLQLISSWITGNSAQYGGGVFQAGLSNVLYAENSVIENNTATQHGGGAYADGNIEFLNTNLTNNTATFNGGGLHSPTGNGTFVFGSFTGNHATNWDGGGIGMNNNVSIFGTEFADNTAGRYGGGVSQWNNGHPVSITGARFIGNSANVNGGGVMVIGNGVLDPTSTITVSGSVFNANTAKLKGGGFYAGDFATVSNTQFTSNVVDSGDTRNTEGGGMYARNGINGSDLTFTTNQAKCTGCTTKSGGGLSITRVAEGPSSITRSTFDGNVAGGGGGLDSGFQVHLTATYSSFINHGAKCDTIPATCISLGGGMYATHLTGDHLLFQNNSVFGDGGGLNAGNATLTNSRFINNSSPGNGGGIKTVTIDATNLLMVDNNSANGAAIRVEALTSSLKHVTIFRSSLGGGSAIFMASQPSTPPSLTIKNSIISGYSTGIYNAGTGSLVEDYNLYYNNTTNIHGGSLGTHSLIANPLFVNPAGGDYHLLKTSPAIGKGTNLGVTRDLDGKPRLNHWDSGAYQFVLGTFLPTVLK